MGKITFLIMALIFVVGVTIGSSTHVIAQQASIPSWVKNTALWWGQNQISDADFIKALQYLIDNGIIKIPQSNVSTSTANQQMSSNSMLGPLWKESDSSSSSLFKAYTPSESKEVVLQSIANPSDVIVADEGSFTTKAQASGEYYVDGPKMALNIPEFNQLRHSPDVICASTDKTSSTTESIEISCYVGVTVWQLQASGGPEIEDATETVMEKIMNYVP